MDAVHARTLGEGRELEDAPEAREVFLVEQDDHLLGTIEYRAQAGDASGAGGGVGLRDAGHVEEAFDGLPAQRLPHTVGTEEAAEEHGVAEERAALG